jgi:hypothetical protein
VTVQQGRLTPTDTTKNMANFYSDAVVSAVTDVDRIIHNGTQFARLVLRRPQPETATRGSTIGTLRTSTPAYIDGSFVANTTSDVNLITIGFDKLITTTTIRVFSTSAISATIGLWAVQTSLNNLEAEFNNSAFTAAISSVTQAIVSTTDGGNQFRYTLVITAPPIDTTGVGLPFWRITHQTAGVFDSVTEVQIIAPLTPTISYFDTNGNFASSSTFEKTNILDAAYDNINNRFYTIRYNTGSVGTSTVTLNDNFGDANAGTASGTSNFNPSRWVESNTNTQFLRASDQLSYNAATGKGQIETTYTLAGNFIASLEVIPTTLTTKPMWLSMRALDTSNNTIMSEGVGYVPTPTVTGVWFSNRISNLVNSTSSSELREVRPLWHNSLVGTDTFTITYNGPTWSVSGSLTGLRTDATTGVSYDATIDANTPLEFVISSTATPTPGEQFTFDLVTVSGYKPPTATGTLKISRIGTNFTANNVVTAPVTVPTTAASIEIFGHTNGSINISADNFTIISGTGTFSNVAVFTVEKTNNTGLVTAPPLIESFDIIGDPSLTYNDFLDGRVQIAATSSGTGGGHVYLKINNKLYKYANNVALGTETGSGAIATTTAQIAKDGTNSLAWTHKSGIGGVPFLTYIQHDETLNITHLKTVDKDTLQDTTTTKQTLLNISNTYSTQKLKVFYDQNDFDTLYYVDASTNLQAFNLDDRISAFMAVNADDVTLPAGTAQQTFVEADVINAWGEALNGKTVTFSVTAGDGAVSPSTAVTASGGAATTQFTVGSTVGVSTVTATVTET